MGTSNPGGKEVAWSVIQSYTPKSSVENVGGLEPWMVLIVGTNDELDVDRGVVRMVADAVLLGHVLNVSQRWAHVQTENGVSFSRILSPRAKAAARSGRRAGSGLHRRGQTDVVGSATEFQRPSSLFQLAIPGSR